MKPTSPARCSGGPEVRAPGCLTLRWSQKLPGFRGAARFPCLHAAQWDCLLACCCSFTPTLPQVWPRGALSSLECQALSSPPAPSGGGRKCPDHAPARAQTAGGDPSFGLLPAEGSRGRASLPPCEEVLVRWEHQSLELLFPPRTRTTALPSELMSYNGREPTGRMGTQGSLQAQSSGP